MRQGHTVGSQEVELEVNTVLTAILAYKVRIHQEPKAVFITEASGLN